jgi:3-phenylpropionate/trans-cinnamate dioxygenase ferredoxin reductase component
LSKPIVIIGGGHAGGSAAAFLRQYGYKGPLVLVGEEGVLPYQRPPLSKAWLKGEATAESLALRPAKFYAAQNIETRLGVRAEAIDPAAHEVRLSNGETLGYAKLILALGSRARPLPLPGRDLKGVLELRTTLDADRLQAMLQPGARLAVVGGGYIGLEVAASAIALGATACVIEREARVLARVASPILSGFVQEYHRAKGVKLLLGAGVEGLEGRDGQVGGIRLADGGFVPCDVALIGVGCLAHDELARAAGLECDNGIVVDLAARTGDPDIYAIGDCTNRPLPTYGRRHRLESVPNAIEQAKQAAADICGRPAPVPEIPWFWSDQFDLRLQMAGLPFGATQCVLRGALDVAGFAVFHLGADDAVLAVEAVNAPADFMAGRMLVTKQKRVAPALLADTGLSMKDLAA